MKKFSELGVKSTNKGFLGDKIKMAKILNREIVVYDFIIADSKFDNDKKENGKFLQIQISLNDVKHVLFTASKVLMEVILKIPKDEFPFSTTIVEENERYEFS